jgi:hypothetical protein
MAILACDSERRERFIRAVYHPDHGASLMPLLETDLLDPAQPTIGRLYLKLEVAAAVTTGEVWIASDRHFTAPAFADH